MTKQRSASSYVIHHQKENTEVSSTIREFLQTLTEKKVELFHSVLRRLVTSLHPVSLFQTTDELMETHQHNIPQILESAKTINYCDLHLNKCIKSMFHWFYM